MNTENSVGKLGVGGGWVEDTKLGKMGDFYNIINNKFNKKLSIGMS